MIESIRNALPEYEIKHITENNYMEISDVFFSNQRFFIDCEGQEITDNGIKQCICATPPEFDIKDKLFKRWDL